MAYVAVGNDGSVLLSWESASRLYPITDDRPAPTTPRLGQDAELLSCEGSPSWLSTPVVARPEGVRVRW